MLMFSDDVSCAVVIIMQVDGALEGFWRSLRPAGPDLSKGWIATSFFMRRVRLRNERALLSSIFFKYPRTATEAFFFF